MFRTLLVIFVLLSPVAALAGQPVQICEATWIDPARADRVVPVRIRMPAGTGRAPLILFSHGLGGSLDSGTDWVQAWAAAGFMTVNIQHAGSDAAVWKGQQHPIRALMGAMNPTQLQARVDDVDFVLDRVAKGGHVGGCDVGRADMREVGMSGHSFGAETTLAIAGGHYIGAAAKPDPRIKASIAFSPQPSRGEQDHRAFGGITMPFFTVTGTLDSFAEIGGTTAQDRLRPYQAMPGGRKYALVLDGASHIMLNGQTLQRPKATPSPEMVETISKATVLFWRATLMHDRASADQLQSFGARLRPGDRFLMK